MISPGLFSAVVPSGDGDPLAAMASLPGVPEAVGEARLMVDRLLAHRVLRTRAAAVAGESALRGARASAALEGVDLPLAEVRAGGTGSPVLAGALRVSAELAGLRPVWRVSPRQALARLHLVAAAGLAAPDLVGRPSGPDGAAALGRMAKLVSGVTAAPALVVAAATYGELLAAAPFAEANAVVARGALRLVLAGRGLDPGLLGIPEVGVLALGGGGAELAAYRTGSADGVAVWLRFCAEAVGLGARESLAVAEAMVRG